MPYMTEDTWLTLSERRMARLENENGEEDDEDSINLQARFERSDAGSPVVAASLPGTRPRNALGSFTPAAPNTRIGEAEHLLSPYRPWTPARRSTIAPTELAIRRPSNLRHSELAESLDPHSTETEAGPSNNAKAWHAV